MNNHINIYSLQVANMDFFNFKLKSNIGKVYYHSKLKKVVLVISKTPFSITYRELDGTKIFTDL